MAGAMASVPATAHAQPTGNICEDQIRAFVESSFGHTVTSVEFRYEDLHASPGEPRLLSQAIVSVAQCPGYYFFEVIGDQYTCERQARYGHVPNLVIFRSRGDGC